MRVQTFKIPCGLLLIIAQACASGVTQVGTAKADDLKEASGLVASRRYPGIFWTHNDGTDGVLYAIRRDGSVVRTFRLDAHVVDWEDIAIDDQGHLYVGDVGNNSRERKHVTVLQINEPDPNQPPPRAKLPIIQRWRLAYPEGHTFNCEALFVWGGQGYVISKAEKGERAGLFRFALDEIHKTTLEKIAVLSIKEPVMAADVSADGKRLAVLARGELDLFDVEGEPARVGEVKPEKVSVPPIQAEGCCFVDEGVLMIAESREILVAKISAPATTQASQP